MLFGPHARTICGFTAGLIFLSTGVLMATEKPSIGQTDSQTVIKLPPPRHSGSVSLEKTLLSRRSVRQFKAGPLKLDAIAQILWAAQGITSPHGRRTSPSAGALYPLEIYLISGQQPDLDAGIYRYQPHGHSLKQHSTEDLRKELSQTAWHQKSIEEAPMTLAIFAVFERTTVKYGERGVRYVHLEAGHSAQNIALQVVAMGLGSVVIGAFRDREIQRLIGSDPTEEPLYLIPVGTPED